MELQSALLKRSKRWASQIRGNIWLGGGTHAANLVMLRENGITHILNVADDVQNFHPDQFEYLNLHVRDFGQDKGISRTFAQTFEWMDAVLSNEQNRVLVHCAAGVNRSATIVLALLMKREGLTLRDAFLDVRKKRNIMPLTDNIAELVRFEHSLFGSNTVKDRFDLSPL